MDHPFATDAVQEVQPHFRRQCRKRAAMKDMAKAFKQDVIDGVQARFGVEETKRVVTA